MAIDLPHNSNSIPVQDKTPPIKRKGSLTDWFKKLSIASSVRREQSLSPKSFTHFVSENSRDSGISSHEDDHLIEVTDRVASAIKPPKKKRHKTKR